MKKSVEAVVDESLFDILGANAIKSVKGVSRKKLVSDCLYYERKIMKILRKLQSISEGVEDLELEMLADEMRDIEKEIDKIEKDML